MKRLVLKIQAQIETKLPVYPNESARILIQFM